MIQEEIHPWNWYIPSEAKLVIIGTFPPTLRNWSYDFFYPNKNNYFWKIMAAIACRELTCFTGDEAVRERKAILDQLGLGLSDMGKIIRRTEGNSLDENLQVVEYMDIARLLDENLSIRKIVFTSSSGKSSAVRWFRDYLVAQGVNYRIPRGLRPLRNSILWRGRLMEIVVLYSTSPRAGAAISFENLTLLFKNEICINNN